MVNLVKIIESLHSLHFKAKFGCSDTEKEGGLITRFLKKHLKKCGADINKLRDTIIHPGLRVTPLQIAVIIANRNKCNCWLEIVDLLMKTKGIEKNKLATYRGKNNALHARYGLLDCATSLSDTPRPEVVKIILEDDETLSLIYDISDVTEEGLSKVPQCLADVIKREHFDVLDLFNSYGRSSKFIDFDPILSLFTATELNKIEVFKHLLPRAKNFCEQNWAAEAPKILKIAKLLGRSEMCNLLRQAGVVEVCEEIEENITKVIEDDIKEEKIEPTNESYKKVCWNCLKPADSVPLYRCVGCRKARYCEEKCQEEDWDRHGKYCQFKTKKRELKIQKRNVSFNENASEVD